MRQLLLSISFFLIVFSCLRAQSGCPGCVVSLPGGLPADTLFLQPLPDGSQGTAYDQDISFRVPISTTPVHAIDSTIPPGLPISKIEIVGIEGLPAGLFWQASQTVFETATQTDGCIKLCGIPLEKDSFVLTVKLKATVFIFTQEASFPMRLYVAPKISTTDGFSMTNFVGCGPTAVSFINNVPSGGNSGFSYLWDFGDGDSTTVEDPAPHTYTEPGIYPVNYHATIDTSGYQLLSVTVLGMNGCSDIFSSGPDVYLFVLNPAGAQIFNSSPEIDNISLPHTFPINLTLEKGTSYRMEAWDEDTGLEGSDDPCGVLYFNALNNGDTLEAGGFKVVFNIAHQVDEVVSSDTVIIYPIPAKPVVTANTFTACAGDDNNIVLQSSFGAGNQWWLNGQAIAGAQDFLYQPKVGGYYQVQVNPVATCLSISDSVLVELYPLPAIPVYENDRNRLKMKDTLAVPDSFALQWYLFAAPIPGATGFTYCALQSGTYILVVTDLNTGCTNEFSSNVVFNPIYDCTQATVEAGIYPLRLFPNPAQDAVTLQLESALDADARLQVWDVAGRLIHTVPVGAGTERVSMNVESWNAGWYAVELTAGGKRYAGQVVIVR